MRLRWPGRFLSRTVLPTRKMEERKEPFRLAAPGTPFRLFTERQAPWRWERLPYVAVPTLLVPLYLMTQLTIAVRLRSVGTGEATTQWQVDNRPQGILT